MKKHTRYIALILAIVFCSTLLLSGCNTGTVGSSSSPSASTSAASQSPSAPAGSDKTSIKIGFVTSLSGPLANFSVGIKHAADLALAAMK